MEKISVRSAQPARHIYPKSLVGAFTAAGAIVVVSILALLLAPLYADAVIMAILLTLLGLSLAALSGIVRRAELLRARAAKSGP